MKTSDVYLRSKVPEDMYDTMQKFAEIRKLDRAALVRDFNLFPVPERLLILERKYGDALSFEDISGIRLRKRRRNRDANVTATTDCVVLGTGDGIAWRANWAARPSTLSPKVNFYPPQLSGHKPSRFKTKIQIQSKSLYCPRAKG
eukprot:CAMPEP_0170451968 /NCGR_PEP_ID=MMETSP0123-20130129/1031_1 /TAXON_ID=182087 /ORGANISM="Favella ehrenbergii, Strain Fehren 1" /LENGTH=144 /DNA_ID=CAMNT_0010713833 /DNA_START=753 /DNA_END=1187 /DNA_ORIENTATION=+